MWPILLAVALSALWPNATADEDKWKVCIVLKRDGETKRYVGRVNSPKIALKADISPENSGEGSEIIPDKAYEIWLLADGATRGLWFDPMTRHYGPISRAKAALGSREDDGQISSLVRQAVPSPVSSELNVTPPENAAKAHASSYSPGFSLSGLILDSDVVAVGRVEGIWRMANTPIGSTSLLQHTVFLFTVEQYLLNRFERWDSVLKINQPGGSLPWRLRNGRTGAGFFMEGNPLLRVGERYIVFLQALSRPGLSRKAPYFEGSFQGVSGKQADWDEYVFKYPLRSKLHIRDGRIVSALADKDWRFEHGEQILGLSFTAATNLLRNKITALAGR